jgi:membrane protease YdiL (CAAX protease family)
MLFAVAHFQFAPMHFLLKFAVGLAYGLLRERYGSLVPAATAHFLTWLIIGWA